MRSKEVYPGKFPNAKAKQIHFSVETFENSEPETRQTQHQTSLTKFPFKTVVGRVGNITKWAIIAAQLQLKHTANTI